MTTQISHFIDGQRTAGQSTRSADVFDPNTGQIQAKVPMAGKSDIDAAVASAVEAQKGWAAWNPQRRARVLMRFIELVNDTIDELAELLSREHGKTLADARGDVQRGIEVIEFCLGIPHLLKGEYTEGAGPGIDVYSLRQPLGVVAGITPFNFPAMIPLWKAGPALACGNAFVLKPSERDPSVPVRLAELFIEAGLPAGVFQVVHGDKEAVDAILHHPRHQGRRLRRQLGYRSVHLRWCRRHRQAGAVFRRCQEPHDRDARRGPGSGRGRTDRRRIRQRRRTLHGDQRRRAGGRSDRGAVARQADRADQ
ncbi:methylmalonate-semialdehyde dehydrogenase [Mycobacterium tuberculosis]|nr:methylmalonate-semialdehyde dehydrogenase [Mycobacterium tuberculosis]